MADCSQAIQSIGSYEYVISGDVSTEAEFDTNVKWISGSDSMDKQDAFASQKTINETAQAYLTSTDWYSIRAAEGGTAMPSDVKTKRAEERAKVVLYANFSG